MELTSYTIERVFSATPDRIFRAFTSPADLQAWIWGDFGANATARVDLRVGGTFEVTADLGREGRGGMRGMYLVVEPARRLTHTLHWDASVGYNGPGMDPLDEVVVVDFLPDAAGCRVRYVHLGIPDDGRSAPGHEKAVRGTFDALERRLAAAPSGNE